MIARYLRALRVPQQEPTREYLETLIRAQQTHFPYESLSKLYWIKAGVRGVPPLEAFLEGQEQFGFGGLCFMQNGHFTALLAGLGFKAELVGVTSNGDVDAHASCRVLLDGVAYHVDLGLLSTFTGPFSLAGGAHEKDESYRQWRFTPHADCHTYTCEMRRDGVARRSFVAKAPARTLASFDEAYAHSSRPDALFVKNVCVFKVERRVETTIWNDEQHVVWPGGARTRKITGIGEFRLALREIGLTYQYVDHPQFG